MRLIKTMYGGYVNCDNIQIIRRGGKTTFDEEENYKTIEVVTSRGTFTLGRYWKGEYSADEKRDIALSELIRRLTNDQLIIEVLNNEQAEEELKKRIK